MIGKDGFVAVSHLHGGAHRVNWINYYGPDKPSVDAPIHVRLYNALPRINYMIHSHTYVQGAPFTEGCIPCGAMQEVDEVLRVYTAMVPVPDQFAINLNGHGSLVASCDVAGLDGYEYYARPLPEDQSHLIADGEE